MIDDHCETQHIRCNGSWVELRTVHSKTDAQGAQLRQGGLDKGGIKVFVGSRWQLGQSRGQSVLGIKPAEEIQIKLCRNDDIGTSLLRRR